jgi:glyoxylase-like metal-dependent hydrolase (beta-lactamase superfamily II)
MDKNKAYENFCRMKSTRFGLLLKKTRVRCGRSNTVIVPSIHTPFTPGHTPGNMALSVVSCGVQLLCLGDFVTHPIYFDQPEWHIAPDCDPK